MATGRMITCDTWEDDFFTSLSVFERLVWLGIITGCADDQGRFQDSAVLIRSKIFPFDDVPAKDIDQALNTFYFHHKIVRYIAGGKQLIQIVNWWKHQKPHWAVKSIYLPPPEWADRYRYHSIGNEILELNWKGKGGYIEGYVEPNIEGYVDGSDMRERREEKDERREEKDEDERNIVGSLIPLSRACANLLKVPEYNGGAEQWNSALIIMRDQGVTPEIIEKAVYRLGKNKGKQYTLIGPQSLLTTCFNIQRERATEEEGAEYSEPDQNGKRWKLS